MYALTNNTVDWLFIALAAWTVVVILYVVQRRHYRQWKAPLQDYSYSSRKVLREQDRGHSTLNVVIMVAVVTVTFIIFVQKFGDAVRDRHCENTSAIAGEEC